MPIDLNDEIVQDFLVEAGEILEALGEQLVDMEMKPDDSDLLNTVFRGFHTVKGGAGFLGLDPLVESVIGPRTCSTCCARANAASTRN